MLNEEPQQVTLRGMADRGQRRHVPVMLRPGDDGILYPVHRRVEMTAMPMKR